MGSSLVLLQQEANRWLREKKLCFSEQDVSSVVAVGRGLIVGTYISKGPPRTVLPRDDSPAGRNMLSRGQRQRSSPVLG